MPVHQEEDSAQLFPMVVSGVLPVPTLAASHHFFSPFEVQKYFLLFCGPVIYSDLPVSVYLQQELLKEQQMYLAHLAQQLEEEKQQQREVDKLLDEEMAKVWAKKAKQLSLEKEARKKLLKDVLNTRQEQIEEKCK